VIGDGGQALDFLALEPQLVPDVERPGVGQDEVGFPPRLPLEDLQDLDAVDRTGRPGEADDQPLADRKAYPFL
jgi:hypothetical protein